MRFSVWFEDIDHKSLKEKETPLYQNGFLAKIIKNIKAEKVENSRICQIECFIKSNIRRLGVMDMFAGLKKNTF